MLGVIGQASGRLFRQLHGLMRLLLLLVLLAGVGVAALAWRLGQAPLVLPWLAAEITAAANRQIAPLRLELGEAALAWEGFQGGIDRPLDIRATDLAIFDAEGRRLAQVPEVRLSLSLRALADGQIALRGLVVQGARLRALRRADGTMAVDFSSPGSGQGSGQNDSDMRSGVPDFAWLLETLAHPPGTDFSGSVLSGADLDGRVKLVSQLRRLQLRDTVVTVQDNALGLVWRVPELDLDITRSASGGVEGTGTLELAVLDRRLSVTAKLRLPSVQLRSDGAAGSTPTMQVEATLASLVPAEFAGLAPELAPLAAIEAPITLTATAELGADMVPRHGRLRARMDGGTLRVAQGRIPVLGGSAEIEGTAALVTLTVQRLALPAGTPGAPPTIVTGTATLAPQAGMMTGVLDLALDQVAFADLASLWPPGMAEGARSWITENITAGIARNLRMQLRMVATSDLSDGAMTGLTGTLEGSDMVVHWLRPVPPTEQGSATLSFISANEIDIAIHSGTQGGIAVTGGQVTLTGLAQRDQYINIAIDLGGPVGDLIGLLNHPRVNLLSRRPITMRNPSGRIEGRLAIIALPLEVDVTFDDVRLSSSGRASGLNLGGIAAGRDLTNGALTFEAGNDGLRLRGTASLAGIPTQLAVEMDFIDGPPGQVIQKITVSGTADAAQLVSLGLDTKELALDGSAALKLDMTSRRNGRSELAVRADLAKLGMRADRLGWGKPVGRPAVAEARVNLDRDRLAGIERLSIDGEGIAVQAALEAVGGAPRRLRLTRAMLTPGTDVQGEVLWPRGDGQPWQIRLTGPSLDISAEMARRDAAGAEVRGPPWNAELRVERLVLGAGRLMAGVVARSDNDGLVTRNARVTGRVGAGPFELSILPSGLAQRRSLTITAADAGALLAALDVMDDMRGGRLTLNASYDDARPGHPLSGTAEVAEFGMRNAPAIGKLLQAITVVGAIEAFSGPDLRFAGLVAPFRREGDVIELTDARAFSASLGVTAKGRIDTARRQFDLHGTVVPAYFLNSLLGRVPLLGRLVSPEAGGGLFAMSFGVKGPFDDPSVWVNPLSAVTPGFLRGLFGVFEGTPGSGGDAPAARPGAPREGGQR